MSKQDKLIKKRMEYITYHEFRPFTYIDFLEFESDGEKYRVAYGTFRNKIRTVFKNEVQVLCYSPLALYTLKDSHVAKSMTDTHTEGTDNPNNINRYSHICNHPLYKTIANIELGKKSIHDVRLRFKVPYMWNELLSQYYIPNSNNDDIYLLKGEENDIKFSVTVHITNTISITLGCTHYPIEIDVNGIMRLWNTLSIIEERIRTKIDCEVIKIPKHKEWIITMWHFSKDALSSYTGEKFCVEFGAAKEILLRIYTKNWNNGKTRIRLEKQEYSMKTIEEAIEEKLRE